MSNILKFSSIILIVTVASILGCTTSSDLAEKVSGQWSGTTVEFKKKTMIDGSFTPTFRFDRAEGQSNGAVTISAMVSVTMPVNAPIDSVGTTAVSATATGLATISGTWKADEGDEIKLHFDMSTLTIDLNPMVNFELANIWAANDIPTERTVAPAVYKSFEKQMTDGLTASLQSLDELDDIAIKDGLMTTKYLGQTRTLNRIFE